MLGASLGSSLGASLGEFVCTKVGDIVRTKIIGGGVGSKLSPCRLSILLVTVSAVYITMNSSVAIAVEDSDGALEVDGAKL